MRKSLFLLALVCLLVPAPLRAQETEPPAPTTFDPTLDAGDLWHFLRHGRADPLAGDPGVNTPTPSREHFFVAAPTIASKPSTGLSAGFNSNLAFFTGDERTTHISSVSAGLRISAKQQVLTAIRFSTFTADDRWFLSGDNRLQWTSLDTYSLGTNTAADGPGTANVKFNGLKLYETAYRTLRPHLFAGLGINLSAHSNIHSGTSPLSMFDQSAFTAYNDRHGFADPRQTSAGTSAGLLYDSRDNGINAQRGWWRARRCGPFSTASSAAIRPGSS